MMQTQNDDGQQASPLANEDPRGMSLHTPGEDARYQALVAALGAGGGPFAWLVTAEGLAKDVDAWCAFTGQRPEEVRGTAKWLDALRPVDRERLTAHFAGEKAAFFQGECRVRRFDGNYHPFSLRLSPVFADGNSLVREWVGACIELPKYRQALNGQHMPERAAVTKAQPEASEQVGAPAEASTTRQLHALLDILPIGVYIADARGRLLHRNAAAEAIWGEDSPLAQEISQYGIYRGWWTKTGLPIATEEWALARALRNGEESIGEEIDIEAFDGVRRTILNSAIPIRDEKGAIAGGVVTIIDITERKRLEREAAAWASELEAVFEALTDGLVVYDARGMIVRMNKAYRAAVAIDLSPGHVSLSPAERGDMLALRDEEGRPLPNERRPVERIISGEVLTGANALDIMIRALDGRDVQFNVSGSPMRDQHGRIIGGVLIFRDVTERRRIERRTHEALDALLAMAEALVTQLPAGERGDHTNHPSTTQTMARRLAELMGRVLGCKRIGITVVEQENGARRPLAVVGLSQEEERRWWVEQQQPALDDAPHPDLVERLRAGEALVLDMTSPPFRDDPNPYGIRTMLIAPMRISDHLVGLLSLDYGGVDHAFSSEERALASAVAKLAGLVIERERLLHERAESRANEIALRESNRRMDEFLGIASHELKTPLTTIKGNVQLAVRRVNTSIEAAAEDERGEKQRQALAMARELLARTNTQVDRLTRLVNDLLDVSRIQAQKLEMQVEPCDLALLVREVVEDQQHMVAPARAISLDVLTPGAIKVVADADRIRQVVTNYLTNALKYSEADRPVRVTVGVEASGQAACVTVRDEGPGLPLEEQKRVWERFYRVPGIEVESGSGVGLGVGLHICRTIVEHHRGHVGVESVPGQGATFWFTLPLVHAFPRE